MPDLQDILAAAVPFALRLRRTFRGLDVREGLLIEGPSGWGEFAPFDDYTDVAAARWLASALEASHGTWPVTQRATVNVNAIIPGIDPTQAGELAREAVLDRGCRTIKVKVGGPLDDDEARVSAVRNVLDASLGSGVGRIRIDANGAWTREAARDALRRLSPYDIEYVEQPCSSESDLRDLHRASPIPIALDETLRTSDDPEELAMQAARLHELGDVVILKPAPLGGIAPALRIAETVDLPVVVSSSLDSSVGLAVAVTLAGALDLEAACGLGTGVLLRDDLVAEPEVPVDGCLAVRRIAPDADALLAARARMDDEAVERWLDRLRSAWGCMKG